MKHRHVRTMSALVGAVLCALLVGSVPAGAASTAGGLMEAFTFKDTEDHPGMTCYYQSASHADPDLIKMVIAGPRLYARDRTGGVDHQMVAWRFIIKGAMGGDPPFTNEYKSSWKTFKADDASGHKFGPRTWIDPKHKNKQWVAHLELRWYKPGSSTVVEATAHITAQWNRSIYPPNPDAINQMPCLPGM